MRSNRLGKNAYAVQTSLLRRHDLLRRRLRKGVFESPHTAMKAVELGELALRNRDGLLNAPRRPAHFRLILTRLPGHVATLRSCLAARGHDRRRGRAMALLMEEMGFRTDTVMTWLAEITALAGEIRASGPAKRKYWAGLVGEDLDCFLARARRLEKRKAEFDQVTSTIIENNLRLAGHWSSNYFKRGQSSDVDPDDVFQEGCVGLSAALDRYDLRRGCQFSTYATFWIRRAISLFFRTAFTERHSALDVVIPEYNESVKERLVARGTSSPLDEVAIIERGRLIQTALDKLPDVYRDVIVSRMGFDCEPETLESIGLRLGVSRERIRQIENKALARLRKLLAGRIVS